MYDFLILGLIGEKGELVYANIETKRNASVLGKEAACAGVCLCVSNATQPTPTVGSEARITPFGSERQSN